MTENMKGLNDCMLNKDSLKIIICCHKPCSLPADPDGVFLPIKAGGGGQSLGIQCDDNVNGLPCDNISTKNKSFCELTAMYWAWKNIKKLYPSLEYIGLNHYRRYFSFERKNFFNDAVNLPEHEVANYKFDLKKMQEILHRHDAVIAKPAIYPYSLQIDYSVHHISDDMRTLKKIIHERCPEYDMAVYSVITCGNRLSHYNMTVIGWKHFDLYCQWLFDILFEAERRIDISKYNDVQGRIFGYMAERLFNVWIWNAGIKVKRMNIVKFSPTFQRPAAIEAITAFRNHVAFCFNKPLRKYSAERYAMMNGYDSAHNCGDDAGRGGAEKP